MFDTCKAEKYFLEEEEAALDKESESSLTLCNGSAVAQGTHKLTNAWLVKGFAKEKQVSLINGAPGIGKTWFSSALAHETSKSGTVFCKRFESTTSRQGIFFQGGMSSGEIIERIASLDPSNCPSGLTVVSCDDFEEDWNLADPLYQDELVDFLKGFNASFVVFDSIGQFLPSGKKGAADIGALVCKIRSAGFTQFWTSSAGATGLGIPDALVDLTLNLTPVDGFDHLTLRVDFAKARLLPSSERAPFYVELIEREGGLAMMSRANEFYLKPQAISLASQGHEKEDIARRLRISLGTVTRWITEVLQDSLESRREVTAPIHSEG